MVKTFLAACALGLALVAPAHAASVLPVGLDDMIDTAGVAFQGTALSNRTERDAETKMIVTYTTFAVRDVLKGDVQFTHVIKQVGGTLPGENLTFKVDGVPTFTVGQDYVLFMAGVSTAGFSSPVGLSQGRFRVIEGPDGLQVSNGRDLREMAARMPQADMPKALLQKSGAPVRELGLDEFKQLVRARLGAAK